VNVVTHLANLIERYINDPQVPFIYRTQKYHIGDQIGRYGKRSEG